MKKIKRIDGRIEEVEDGYVLKQDEEETSSESEGEELEEEQKKVFNLISKKLETLVEAIKDNPVGKSPVAKLEATPESSVLETDPYLRRKRPFVRLSGKMDKFIEGVRALAKNDLGMAVKALAEGTDTSGGFLVPEEFQAEVIRYMDEAAIIRPRARVFNMTRDKLTLPSLDQSSSVFGGVVIYAAEEAELKTASQPTFGHITLNAKKAIGLCPVSDELLEDSAINLANFLVGLFGEAVSDYEDTKFIKGTGMGEPLGIIKASGINVVTRNASTRIKLEDVLALWKNLPSQFDGNSVWITNKAGMEQLMLINSENTGGLFLWMPSLREAMPSTVLGKPVLTTERVESLGTAGDIILGDLSQYYIGDRGGLKVDSSIHDRFRYDETTFRFVKRFDGQPGIAKAFAILRD